MIDSHKGFDGKKLLRCILTIIAFCNAKVNNNACLGSNLALNTKCCIYRYNLKEKIFFWSLIEYIKRQNIIFQIMRKTCIKI